MNWEKSLIENTSSANNDESKYMKNNLNKQISKVDNISKNLKELIENASEDKETITDELSKAIKIPFGIWSFEQSTSNQLYYNDSIYKIYQLLSKNRVTK